MKWGKVIDQERCIGCHACTVACKAEHAVPVGVTRTFVKTVETGRFPETSRHFQITRCNQCEDPPCVPVCPVTAMFQRPDGIVDFDREVCIGCKACIAACPYDAIYIDPESDSAEKCNFCAHRIDQGLEPACVAVCPERAIIIGDLDDPASPVSRIVARQKALVRRPEKGTRPKLFYVGGSEFTLRPGLAEPSLREAEHPSWRAAARPPRMAEAMLSYDVPRQAPWGWHVSLYTWTKSVAAGTFLVPAALSLAGMVVPPLWQTASCVLALVFLAITGGLLVADLTHPSRFLSIFFRPQWRSWLTRGAFIISAYGLLLVLSLFGGWTALRWPTAILALLTAVYTAFLFAQSKGRDLWQNPLLPLDLTAQAVAAGAAALLVVGAPIPGLGWMLLAGVAGHVAVLLSEWLVPHATFDGARAFEEMTRGRFATLYWVGASLSVLSLLTGTLPPLAATAALVGIVSGEHAYVQAGQVVPQA